LNKDHSSAPQVELNRIIRENRVDDYPSTNLALGMRPLEFGPGTSGWLWEVPPEDTINPFGTMQGGYLAVFIDEILSTAIGSVLEEGEWAVTAELKLSYLRAVPPRRLNRPGPGDQAHPRYRLYGRGNPRCGWRACGGRQFDLGDLPVQDVTAAAGAADVRGLARIDKHLHHALRFKGSTPENPNGTALFLIS